MIAMAKSTISATKQTAASPMITDEMINENRQFLRFSVSPFGHRKNITRLTTNHAMSAKGKMKSPRTETIISSISSLLWAFSFIVPYPYFPCQIFTV